MPNSARCLKGRPAVSNLELRHPADVAETAARVSKNCRRLSSLDAPNNRRSCSGEQSVGTYLLQPNLAFAVSSGSDREPDECAQTCHDHDRRDVHEVMPSDDEAEGTGE